MSAVFVNIEIAVRRWCMCVHTLQKWTHEVATLTHFQYHLAVIKPEKQQSSYALSLSLSLTPSLSLILFFLLSSIRFFLIYSAVVLHPENTLLRICSMILQVHQQIFVMNNTMSIHYSFITFNLALPTGMDYCRYIFDIFYLLFSFHY